MLLADSVKFKLVTFAWTYSFQVAMESCSVIGLDLSNVALMLNFKYVRVTGFVLLLSLPTP